MFWGITLDAGKRYTQTVEQSFHLSMAALGFQNSSAHPVTVMVEVEKAQFALCTLKPGSIPQQPLDYTFTEGEEITFFTEGQGEVHLTGYLIEEVDPVDFEGENELSNSEDESESESASDDDKDSKSSSSEEVTLQDLLMDAAKAEEGSADEDEEDDDDDWDPSKGNPSPKKKKKEKNKKGLRKKDKNKDGEPQSTSSLFFDWESEDEDDDEWNPDDGADKPTKKTKGKKRKAEKSKEKPEKNGDAAKSETTVITTNAQDERPKKKAKKSKGSTVSSPEDVMHININESKQTVKQEDTPHVSSSDSSQHVESPNKNKHLRKDKEGKQDFKSSTSPTKKLLKKTLPGGVIIEDLKKGTGQVATNGQKVSLLYKGVLAKNKKQFDANLSRKSPFTFILGKGEVIRGWDLGIAGMQVGGKRKLIVPPSQGYGNERMGPIPPQSTLEFEVELVSTK